MADITSLADLKNRKRPPRGQRLCKRCRERATAGNVIVSAAKRTGSPIDNEMDRTSTARALCEQCIVEVFLRAEAILVGEAGEIPVAPPKNDESPVSGAPVMSSDGRGEPS